MSKTIVVFRMEGDSCLAVFPHTPADHQGREMECFSRIGQHARCSAGYLATTQPAKPDEYAALKRELESAPYRYKLAVRKRIPSGSYEARRAALGAP